MARPTKKNADWFKHLNNMRNNRRVVSLREEFGPSGYGIYHYILEVLAEAPGFELQYESKLDKTLLAGDFRVKTDELERVILYMIDVELLKESRQGFLFSPYLHEALSGLMEEREKDRERKENKKAEVNFPGGKPHTENIFRSENSQRREEKSRVEKSREENIKDVSDGVVLLPIRENEYDLGQFIRCWEAFGKYGSRKKSLEYWKKLTEEQRSEVETAIPSYTASTPACKYRKYFEGWINPANELWKRPVANHGNATTATGQLKAGQTKPNGHTVMKFI